MDRPRTADNSHLRVNAGGEPRPQRPSDPPRHGVVTAETYGSELGTLEVDVVARPGPWLCVGHAAPPDWPSWFAWVPSREVKPRPRDPYSS